MNLTSVDSLFVRVCTDASVDGWGEGWGHVACPATSAVLTTLVGPAFIGSDISDRSRLMTEMFRRFHIHGRTGPVVYALSAIEIALWDIAGKLASSPIASLLGGAPRELTAYASLLRYAEPELVASAVDRALAQGFRHIKLHELVFKHLRLVFGISMGGMYAWLWGEQYPALTRLSFSKSLAAIPVSSRGPLLPNSVNHGDRRTVNEEFCRLRSAVWNRYKETVETRNK